VKARDESVQLPPRASRLLAGRAALAEFARGLAGRLRPGCVVALSGPLGAGKTTLVRELVALLGLDPARVTSPTFSLVNVYEGRTLTAYHVDLYRAEGEADLAGIDLEEFLYAPAAITFVEWPEKLSARFPLPPGALRVRLEFAPEAGPDGRRVRIDNGGGGSTGRGAADDGEGRTPC
jgi:tRNA threonylcarbamoyl adenosine modification protein YjeE